MWKYFHIICYEEKFTPHLVQKLNNYFLDKSTYYCLVDKRNRDNIPEELFAHKNVMIYRGVGDFLKAFRIAIKSEIVIYNALFYRFFLQMQLLLLGIFKKKVWIMWGADMYLRKQNAYNAWLLSHFCAIATPIVGDYESYLRIWSGKAKNLRFFFPFSTDVAKIPALQKSDDKVWIQVGNSGHNTNRHLEVLKLLTPFKDEKIYIVIPLSYSCTKEYQDEVKSAYEAVFGENVLVLTKDLPFNDYVRLLSQIDIGIFYHPLQEAGHNVMLLECLGKKVYICEQNTMLNMSEKIFKVKVFNAKELQNINFNDFKEWSENDSKENIAKMRYFISDEFFIDEVKKFYSALEELNDYTYS